MHRLLAQALTGRGTVVRTSVVYGSQLASCDEYDNDSRTWRRSRVKYGKSSGGHSLMPPSTASLSESRSVPFSAVP